jgi:GH35 family endo-1,4-beta-xylanase
MRCSASRLFSLLATLAVLLSVSCGKQDPVPDPDPPEPVDPNPPSVYKYGLRELARANDLLLGTAFTYSEYNMDQPLKEVLKRDFDAVTFGNEMKHDEIVQADGSLRFQTADTMVGWLKDCDAQLFGHTLGWHSQQQTDYLDKMIREAPDAATAASRIRELHKSWVDAMIDHFDAYGWDVVNEVLMDNGEWRSTANTPAGRHIFVWGNYYPGGTKGFVDAAFRSAQEALKRNGKQAILYINDYNLEWNPSKLEAICQYAENNPDVTGIGSQMHCSTDLTEDGIKNMLNRMVRTGKKVRISELDVPQGSIPERSQADVIVMIFKQYLDLVPEAQRGGITFWGVSDKNTWLGKGKYPLLYDSLYKRKDSYRALHAYLLARAGLE